MFYLGYDLGSSSIKASLISKSDGAVIAIEQYPKKEMPIIAKHANWAEQDPHLWWENLCIVTKKLIDQSGCNPENIKGIGISYQMHGLVLVDKDMDILRPSIIWCDSRAVGTGDVLYEKAGKAKCIDRLLNAPGNFTLSKLKWVKDNELDLFKKIYKFMLPGDYIAYRLSGKCLTTPSGLSEGIIYDFKDAGPARWLMEEAGIPASLLPEIQDSFSNQGAISKEAATATGLPAGIPILYRAGDQPNNALALNVFNPGEIAATGGTSGVVYAVSESKDTQESVRINNFAHVNHTKTAPRIGKMLCINGTGIQYSWMRSQIASDLSYEDMNTLAASVSIGADGLAILPFGNGAERMLENKNIGSTIGNLSFNIHHKAHLLRAALEGIAFSFVYGLEILKEDGVTLKKMKAGNDNLFRSQLFSETIATLADVEIDIVATTGAVGAARAAGYVDGAFENFEQAVQTDQSIKTFVPLTDKKPYKEAYNTWKKLLIKTIKN